MAEYRELIRRMTNAINVMDGMYGEWARKQGVKANIITLMYALDDGELHCQKQLCDEWLIPKTTLNTIVKECEAAGLLVLKVGGGHRREKQICLTEQGRDYAARILEPLYKMEDEAMRRTLLRFSKEFIDGLEYFCANLKNELLVGAENDERNN